MMTVNALHFLSISSIPVQFQCAAQVTLAVFLFITFHPVETVRDAVQKYINDKKAVNSYSTKRQGWSDVI